MAPYLAPDATALGQIFWYTVEGEGQDLGRLRAIQDWYVRYQTQFGARRGPGRLGRRNARSSTRSTSIPTSSVPTT